MLEISNLQKSFPYVFEPVLKNLSLKLDEGDFCIIIGSNGSGKSTLLKSISGEHLVDKGSIKLNKQNITNFPIHKRAELISSVTQDITQGTVQELTLLENVVLNNLRGKKSSFRFYKNHTKEIKERIENLNLGIERHLNTPLKNLSGGQRQLIATLMATLFPPQLLLLDEHTSALDPKTRIQVMEYTNQVIMENKITTLMVTHNLDDALKYGNRLIVMHQGKVVREVDGSKKKELNLSKLLEIFHHYEDLSLVKGENK